MRRRACAGMHDIFVWFNVVLHGFAWFCGQLDMLGHARGCWARVSHVFAPKKKIDKKVV